MSLAEENGTVEQTTNTDLAHDGQCPLMFTMGEQMKAENPSSDQALSFQILMSATEFRA